MAESREQRKESFLNDGRILLCLLDANANDIKLKWHLFSRCVCSNAINVILAN